MRASVSVLGGWGGGGDGDFALVCVDAWVRKSELVAVWVATAFCMLH